MLSHSCLSTGVIKRDVTSTLAHIEIVNLSPRPVTVCVFGFDWDTNPPVAIPVTPGSPIVIPANSNRAFDVSLASVSDHYEIRIALPGCQDIIANVFALTAGGNVVAGNTVLFKELVSVSNCLCKCCTRRTFEEDPE